LKDAQTRLASCEPLPLLSQTAWEETTLTEPIAKPPQAFIRDLMPENLPLAASPGVRITAEFKRETQEALIGRTQNARPDPLKM